MAQMLDKSDTSPGARGSRARGRGVESMRIAEHQAESHWLRAHRRSHIPHLVPRRAARAGVIAAAVALCAASALAALVPASVMANVEACPNAAERFGASANLPDCRAYELVTPAVKEDNGDIFAVYGYPDGEHVVMNSLVPLPGARNGDPTATLMSRTASGWVTTPLAPPQGPGESESATGDQEGPQMQVSFTSDFSTAFVDTPYADSPLDQNRSLDVYGINVSNGSSWLESLPDTGAMTESLYHPPGVDIGELAPGSFLKGSSADGSRVFFSTRVGLPTAPGTPVFEPKPGFGSSVEQLYERHAGHTYVASVLPDGSLPECGAEIGWFFSMSAATYYSEPIYGSVSPDGSNVVFHTPSFGSCGAFGAQEGQTFYLRENNGTPQAKTVKLPGVAFPLATVDLERSADGTKLFTRGEGEALYEYDIPTGQTTQIGTGEFLASSADGSIVYYIGSQGLEVYDNGTTKAISNAAGSGYVGPFPYLPVATPDGSELLFLAKANLTSYDSEGPECSTLKFGYKGPAQYCAEAYIYKLKTGSFTCVSCNPNGTPPSTNASLFFVTADDTLQPDTTPLLSEDGSRAFFETSEALVPQDTNGLPDVYEWENGHVYLISSGQGSGGSTLVGVSSNGDNVFIQTTDVLAPQNEESSLQVYDARVDGGFPYTAPVYGCDSGQCQGPQTPAPVFAPAASATFVGLGNPANGASTPTGAPSAKRKAAPSARCRKGFARRMGRCVRRPRTRKANRKGKGRK
jgi:hypothetical protein